METMSYGAYQWQMHMEQSFHEKQGGSVPDEHNSQPTDDADERFLTVRLLKSEGIVMLYMCNKTEEMKILFS